MKELRFKVSDDEYAQVMAKAINTGRFSKPAHYLRFLVFTDLARGRGTSHHELTGGKVGRPRKYLPPPAPITQPKKFEVETRPELMNVPACYYCGAPATDRDHAVPQSVLKTYQTVGDEEVLKKLIRGRRLMVPSCKECNSLLGASVQTSLKERKELVKEKIAHKYAKILAAPGQTDEELAGYGDDLKGRLLQMAAEKDFIRRRLAW